MAEKQPAKRIAYTLTPEATERVREFMRENDFRSERDAIAALIEGALDNFPRWGVKKGIARSVAGEVRAMLLNKAREKSNEIARELEEAMSSPPLEDQVLPSDTPDDF